MLEKYGLSYAGTFGIYRPYFMAAIVLPSVPQIKSGDGVLVPHFLLAGHDM